MLVLNRKVGERLVIGPNIVVTILEIRGSTVKLGCEAPLSVPIDREEVSSRRRCAEFPRLENESPYFVECA